MSGKKEFLKFFLVVLFLGLAGTALGYGVKKLQTPLAEAKKANKEAAKTKNKKE
jgi:hypothetical protein